MRQSRFAGVVRAGTGLLVIVRCRNCPEIAGGDHFNKLLRVERKNPLSATGRTVQANVRRLREAENLSYAELSRRLEAIGRRISELGLRRIEGGDRRVDADDLMALAVALDVSPIALLMPETTGEQWDETPIGATGFPDGIAPQRFWNSLRASTAPPGSRNSILWLGRSLPWPVLSATYRGPMPGAEM